jgi:hypothetical protein
MCIPFHWPLSQPPEQRKVIETRSGLGPANGGESMSRKIKEKDRDTRTSRLIISTRLQGQGLEGDERVQAVVRV